MQDLFKALIFQVVKCAPTRTLGLKPNGLLSQHPGLFILKTVFQTPKVVTTFATSIAVIIFTATVLSDCANADSPADKNITAKEVSFRTSDDGLIYGSLFGDGDHAVVLAHGAIFNKESWDEQSKLLASRGLRVLAIDFRGYGKSKPGSKGGALHLDVLAAIRYLRAQGAKRVSVVGGSMGGGAAATASVESKDKEIDRLILLAHSPTKEPEKLKGNKLFIVSRGDGSRGSVEKQFKAAPEPKKFVQMEGNAHAQHIFRSGKKDELTKHIVDWLTAEK